MQQCVTGTVSCSTGASRLATLAKVFRLTAKGALINAAFFGARKWQTHVLELENRFRAGLTHILNRFLITNKVSAFNGVIHVPLPLIIGIITGNCTGDTALGGNGVRACWKYFGDYCCFVS